MREADKEFSMRRYACFALVAVCLLNAAANLGFADSSEKAGPAATTNKFCPVMGTDSAADPTIRLEHEGQYVYFCCQGCLNTFKKDPAAYVSKMSSEEQAAIKTNDVCPMTGEKIADRSIRSETNGKLVYFCCAGCKAGFDKKNSKT
jgi:YHS domain-containing protein